MPKPPILPQDWFTTTEDKWVDKLCQLVALEEDFKYSSLISAYQELNRSVDVLLKVISFAKEQSLSLEDAVIDYYKPQVVMRQQPKPNLKSQFQVKIQKKH